MIFIFRRRIFCDGGFDALQRRCRDRMYKGQWRWCESIRTGNGTRAVVPRVSFVPHSAATEADSLTVSQRTNRRAAARQINRFGGSPRFMRIWMFIFGFVDNFRSGRSAPPDPAQARSVTPVGSSPLRTGVLTATEADAVASWADAIESWPVGTHVWGQYAEQITDRVAVCRTENVSACHPGVAALVDGPLRDLAAGALGEPAVAFKDKINYKHPGGAGFRPHQDRLAYPGVARVLSILVAIDECTAESGCLWLVRSWRRAAADRRPRRRSGRRGRFAALGAGRARCGRRRAARRPRTALQRSQPRRSPPPRARRQLRTSR